MTPEEREKGLKLLRKPFPGNQINLLPRPYKKDSPRGNCPECGGYHGLPALHLKYIGHAALTDRLLDCDEAWNWEPLALDGDGLPKLDKDGGLWIKLTVCGVTRLGYGDAQGKTGGDAMKERIGDALRNGAMRFGAALELWHKGDLHIQELEEQGAEPKEATAGPEKARPTHKKISAFREELERSETLNELRDTWLMIPSQLQAHLVDAKDAVKKRLEVSEAGPVDNFGMPLNETMSDLGN